MPETQLILWQCWGQGENDTLFSSLRKNHSLFEFGGWAPLQLGEILDPRHQ